MGGIVKRQVEVGVDTCLLGFGGRDYIESAVFDASSLELGGGGIDEQQTVTITGSPTGGTFTLTFGGQTTAGIAYNAIGVTVQTALEALSTIDDGDVHVTGGAGGPYTVTFINTLGSSDQPLLTASGASLTGGTSPAVGVVQTRAGSPTSPDMRFLVGSADFPGTIVKKVAGTGGAPDKVVEFDGTGNIFGVIDGVEEFIVNTSAGDRDVAIFAGPGVVFDATKIKNYSTHKTAFDTWAAANSNRVRFG